MIFLGTLSLSLLVRLVQPCLSSNAVQHPQSSCIQRSPFGACVRVCGGASDIWKLGAVAQAASAMRSDHAPLLEFPVARQRRLAAAPHKSRPAGASVHFTGLGPRAPAKCPNAWIRAQLRVDSILPFHLLALITTRLDGITSLFARSSRTATHPACNLIPPPWSASPPRTTSSSPSTAMSPSDPCSSSRCSKVSQSPRAR
ncbi:hypothetical protein L1887_51940 [Cichorium endivia]|nr:hypothetical protein L1887_51940 [Cichorium endivia]